MSAAAFDILATALLLCKANGDIYFANSAAEHLFSTSRSKLHGQHLSQLLGESAELNASLNALNSGAAARRIIDLELALPSGLRSLQLTLSMEGAAGDLTAELYELQSLKILQEQQKVLQQNAQRELLRNLAHEIRNPLGGIRGAAQLLQRQMPESAEYTDVISTEAQRLQHLLDQMLTPYRGGEQKTSVSLHEILENVRATVLAEFDNQLTVKRDYDISLPNCWGDRAQLTQAFLNIARNAAQALSESQTPSASLRLQTRALRQTTLGHTPHKLALELLIEDNGPGIPANLKPSLFLPLVTGRAHGTGLGLHISQTIIAQHGGAITAESQAGQTTFRIVLPVETV